MWKKGEGEREGEGKEEEGEREERGKERCEGVYIRDVAIHTCALHIITCTFGS